MPVYEYKCFIHGVWEYFQFDHNPKKYQLCPKCHAPCEKIINRPALLIIGAKFGDDFFAKKYLDPKKSISESMRMMENNGALKQVTRESQVILKKHLRGELWNPQYVRKFNDSLKIKEEIKAEAEKKHELSNN